MTMISVVNASTLISDADVRLAVRACAHQLRYDAAPRWGLAPIPVVWAGADDVAPAGSWVITVYDDADQADALGWHTEDGGVTFGRVFARPILDHGGTALDSALSVSSVLSHEVLETFGDPRVNLLAADGQGRSWCLELCDPVESDGYPVSLSDRGATRAVWVSDFVYPAWFDPQAAGPYSFLGKPTAPFTVADGGYAIVYNRDGSEHSVYGASYQQWRTEMKATPLARTARRRAA